MFSNKSIEKKKRKKRIVNNIHYNLFEFVKWDCVLS